MQSFDQPWQPRLDWTSPAGLVIDRLLDALPRDRPWGLVIAKTGHPTAVDLITALRRVVDIYRPSFDEESTGNPASNTRVLCQKLFGTDIDVRQQIITPALALRRQNYGAPDRNLKQSLEALSATDPTPAQPEGRSEPKMDSQ